jgi:DNA-binding transcriptional LysR family regulator
MSEEFRVGFAAGVTPDKWARAWADRMPRRPLLLEPLGERDGVALLRSGELAMCFVRLPVDAAGLHVIPLYDEEPVVVVSREHPVAVFDEVDVADLSEEHLLQDPDDVPAWRDLATEVRDGTRHPVPAMTLAQAVETVAAGTGIVVLPLSLARLHHRKDLAHVPVTGVAPSSVGLAWLRPGDQGEVDDRIDTFVGVVRGRTANTSRDERPAQAEPARAAGSPPSRRTPSGRTGGQGGRGGAQGGKRTGGQSGRQRRSPRR